LYYQDIIGSFKRKKDIMAQRHQLKDSEYHLSPHHIKKMINAPERFRNRCIIKTFAQTGIRRFELANLDVRDIDFPHQRLHIREGKGGKDRVIPVSEDLLGDLRYHIGKRGSGPVFVSAKGGPLTARQINRIVASAGAQAGVKNPNPKYSNITCHLFRHSFAREWKRQGGSTESLAKILGHTSVKTTLDEYGTEALEEVQSNYERIMAQIY
jgi:integrase/recombinase XerD